MRMTEACPRRVRLTRLSDRRPGPGLHTEDDGSLTIAMSPGEPSEPERRANWLPTPAGTFRPILRLHEPDDAVFDGRYELPAITRTR